MTVTQPHLITLERDREYDIEGQIKLSSGVTTPGNYGQCRLIVIEL